jgi:hypothetical protein
LVGRRRVGEAQRLLLMLLLLVDALLAAAAAEDDADAAIAIAALLVLWCCVLHWVLLWLQRATDSPQPQTTADRQQTLDLEPQTDSRQNADKPHTKN